MVGVDGGYLAVNVSVTESVLNNDDIPWEVLKRRGFESVRLMELTRFYLQLKEDPHGPNVALFVGNLPPNLNEKQYETILLDYLDDGTRLFMFSARNCQIFATSSVIFFSLKIPGIFMEFSELGKHKFCYNY